MIHPDYVQYAKYIESRKMNEQIRQIALDAGFLLSNNGKFAEDEAVELFAKMIAEKCADIAWNWDTVKRPESMKNFSSLNALDEGVYICELIKHIFEVEK